MGVTSRFVRVIALGVLLATLLPGVCTVDCAASMECCRRGPAPETVLGSSTCCKAGKTEIPGPSVATADLRLKPGRDISSVELVVHAPASIGLAGLARASADQALLHRAPDVPIYLMNAVVLC